MGIAAACLVLAWLAALTCYDIRERRLPNALTLNPGQTGSFEVTFQRTTAALNAYTGGQLTWSDGRDHSVRIPIVVRPLPLSTPAEVSSTGGPISYDVKFGFERSLDPTLSIGNQYGKQFIEGAADYQGIFKDPKGLKSIETPDDKTIVFHLNRPLAAFPNVASTGPFVPFPAKAVTSPQQIGQ